MGDSLREIWIQVGRGRFMRWGGFMWAGEGPGRPGMWLKADRVGMGPSACTHLGKVGHISILNCIQGPLS